MSFSAIYIILNKTTNKLYIGSAVNISKRFKNHKIELRLNRHCNVYLQSAWNKYGEDDFMFLILEPCEEYELIEREQFWIDGFESYNREIGYNLQPTAGSMLGYKPTKETLAKLSAIRKGKKRSEAAKAAIKAGWEKRRAKGPVSEETKRKLSESHKGKIHSEETRVKMSMGRIGNQRAKGSVRSEEHLKAMFQGRMKNKKSC